MCIQSKYPQTKVTSAQFAGIEVYARILTICEMLAIFERWRNEGPEDDAFFRGVVDVAARHFGIDHWLHAIFPRHHAFEIPIAERSRTNPNCFKETVAQLIAGRDQALPYLLLTTYRLYPPAAAEAYRCLKLDDIQAHLEKIARVLKVGPSHEHSWSLDRHEEYVSFLLRQLEHYNIKAETYAEAVLQYAELLNNVFPAGREAAPGDVVASISPPPYREVL
jgi:hypothetical protein